MSADRSGGVVPTPGALGPAPALVAARALVAELAACGVRDVVLAPGSRSAPLAYALAAADAAGEITLHVRVDERAAGFLALGLAKGSAIVDRDPVDRDAAGRNAVVPPRPVVVVTTSGTAVANLHPAVLEAHHADVPLVLVTADRPHELRGTGASQTTDQVGIFGAAVRYALDVPAPDGRDGEVRDLLAAAGRALAAATGLRDRHPGPAHLNLAFREPLQPALDADADPAIPAEPALPTVAPFGAARRTVVVPAAPGPGADPALPGDPAHTLVVAGDGAGPDARRLAQAQGWPLLAEPSSGACGGPHAVQAYRAALGVEELVREVEHVVVFGHPTLSRPVQRLLGRADVAVTVVAPGGGPWPDAARNATRVVDALDERWLRPSAPGPSAPGPSAPGPSAPGPGALRPDVLGPDALSPAAVDGSAFLARWRAASRAAGAVVERATAAVEAGPLAQQPDAALAVARAVAAATGPGDVLVVGSSNPVRDLDLVLCLDRAVDAPTPDVVANRGLAGIDGTVSTASGVALAAARAGRRTRALLGDLTFLHDVGGLLRGPLEPAVDLQFVVVNDDGGSIFATLEHGALADASDAGAAVFERVFATPHGADLGALCAGYGVGHRAVADVAGLRAALAAPARGVEVVEVRAPRADRLARSRALHDQVVGAIRAVLAQGDSAAYQTDDGDAEPGQRGDHRELSGTAQNDASLVVLSRVRRSRRPGTP
ncbi:2-succinyl-5-enolpyruvyl-6-hydroxy-3-cyclohexene-1-carboxylic-acid synthase [Xylanimonas ulmi]|uniref:2-succinyl-5-enolpyruvyl-6-hydroxy-3-cyclohexene-1-carboxylate synthase n=1 Tax=Xylanimonas ulmi TaxID=228973 RepID=A0A4Q7M7H2_9MICO|nr:2-succinyl-5-enolpyruvyl-6-hydroxy-3-cyclohexene-1-carboxylic-acid synthase [Xylanibacterium ulmi]RZS63053.1 2-succinyl-5-enolpyruvyl-6-hydroxy-3-cyclohexene-1-carboxylate synthase [Xylanibacterium ulmi]